MTMSLGSFPTVRKKLCLCVLERQSEREREKERQKERWSEEEIVEAEKNVEEKLSIEL